jgi:hypothetical protein
LTKRLDLPGGGHISRRFYVLPRLPVVRHPVSPSFRERRHLAGELPFLHRFAGWMPALPVRRQIFRGSQNIFASISKSPFDKRAVNFQNASEKRTN